MWRGDQLSSQLYRNKQVRVSPPSAARTSLRIFWGWGEGLTPFWGFSDPCLKCLSSPCCPTKMEQLLGGSLLTFPPLTAHCTGEVRGLQALMFQSLMLLTEITLCLS